MISFPTPLAPAPAQPSATLRWLELSELVARCQRLLSNGVSRHTLRHGLGEVQLSLLWACNDGPEAGLSQCELSQALSLSAAHISGQVEQLRAKGLLAGHRRPPDRRRQVWQLTDQGREGFQSLLSELVAWAEPLEQQLSPERREMLWQLLLQLANVLAEHDAADASEV